MLVHLPWYSRFATSQRPARTATTLGFTVPMASSHWICQGLLVSDSPGVSGEPLQAEGVVSTWPSSSTAGPSVTPQPRIPLSERTQPYVLSPFGPWRPIPSVSATESPKRSTFTGWTVAGAPATVVVVVVGPLVTVELGKVVLATATVPVVAATIAATTTTTAVGTATHAFHWRRNVPMRIGRSTRWNDATETAKVTSTRTAKSGYPVSPVRAWSTHRKRGQCQM